MCWLGRALRTPLRFLPESAVLPVLQGPLMGDFWALTRSNHGCWLGSYELEKADAFARSLTYGMTVLTSGRTLAITLLSLLGGLVHKES